MSSKGIRMGPEPVEGAVKEESFPHTGRPSDCWRDQLGQERSLREKAAASLRRAKQRKSAAQMVSAASRRTPACHLLGWTGSGS